MVIYITILKLLILQIYNIMKISKKKTIYYLFIILAVLLIIYVFVNILSKNRIENYVNENENSAIVFGESVLKIIDNYNTVRENALPDDITTPSNTTQPNTTTPALKATFYEHCDYQGWNYSYGIGEYSSVPFPNDRLSSVKVPKGLKVILYEHGGFGGRSLELTSDESCLVGKNFNDITSSFKVLVDNNIPLDNLKIENKPGNNGTVSCQTFCNGTWHGRQPLGKCVKVINNNGNRAFSCTDVASSVAGSLQNLSCDCEPAVYPPINLPNGYSNTVSKQPYGNGLYKISTTTERNGAGTAASAFNEDGNFWQLNPYKKVDTMLSDKKFNGDYVQLELPNPINITGYYFTTMNINNPTEWALGGSNDGNKWTYLDYHNFGNIRMPFNKKYIYNVSNPGSYKFIRFIYIKSDGDYPVLRGLKVF